jgi:hypothetical protein
MKHKKIDDSQIITGLVEGAVVILLQAQKYMKGLKNKKEQQGIQQMIDESLMEFIDAKYFKG